MSSCLQRSILFRGICLEGFFLDFTKARPRLGLLMWVIAEDQGGAEFNLEGKPVLT